MNKMADHQLDTLRMLIEYHFVEDKLFWVRNNVFLLINTGALGLTLANFANARIFTPEVTFITVFFGVGVCYLWWRSQRAAKYHLERWWREAQRFALRDEVLKCSFCEALKLNLLCDAKDECKCDSTPTIPRGKEPGRPRCTDSALWLILLCAVCWIAMGFYKLVLT